MLVLKQNLQLKAGLLPKVLYIMAFWCVCCLPHVQAQDCNAFLEEAMESLGQEDYDHIIVMIADCPEKLVEKTKKMLAYELLARAYFVNNKIELTKTSLNNLLDLQPEYDPLPPQYSEEFIAIVKEMKAERARQEGSLLRNKWFWAGSVGAISAVTFLVLRGGGGPDLLPEAPGPVGTQ